jgi:hypothetical protein
LGQTMLSESVKGGEISTLNVQNLASGIYQIVMRDKTKLVVKP